MSSEKVRLALLFAGGPVLALATQSLTLAGVPWACVTGNRGVLHLLPGVFGAAAVGLTVLAYASWSRARQQGDGASSHDTAGARFLALGAVTLSAASVVLILAMWVPLFVFDPCVR